MKGAIHLLFKPSALSPDSNAFDATLAQLFSWTNNGDAQSHFQLKIYKNTDSTQVYDSTKIASIQSQFTLPSNSLSNNNDYKYQLTVFSGSASVQSDFIFIKTYATPVITMTVPASISTRSYTFTASYSQTQNVPYQSFKFILYDSSDTVIVDSGILYGYNLTHTFEGFDAAKTYKVECIAYASYSLTGTTGKLPFSVSYTQPDGASYLVSAPQDNTGGIQVSWPSLVVVTGVATGATSYVTGKFGKGVQIPSNGNVVFNQTVPLEFSLNFWVKLPSGFTGDFLSLGNSEVIIGYNTLNQFYLNSDGNVGTSNIVSLPTDFFKVCIKPDKVIIETATYTEYI